MKKFTIGESINLNCVKTESEILLPILPGCEINILNLNATLKEKLLNTEELNEDLGFFVTVLFNVDHSESKPYSYREDRDGNRGELRTDTIINGVEIESVTLEVESQITTDPFSLSVLLENLTDKQLETISEYLVDLCENDKINLD